MKQTTGCFDYRNVRYRYRAWVPENMPSVHDSSCRFDMSPMVLVHGFSQSSETWQRVAPLFARTRPVYALDLVGHGGSQAPHEVMPYLLARQAEALLAFVHFVRENAASVMGAQVQKAGAQTAGVQTAGEQNDIAPKAIVVGYSLGGRVVVQAACASPEGFQREIAAVILESAGLGLVADQDVLDATKKDQACARRLRESGLVAFMNWWERQPVFATHADLDEEVRSNLRADRLANDEEALARTFEHAGQHCMPRRAEVVDAAKTAVSAGVFAAYITGQRDKKYRLLARLIRSNTQLVDVTCEIVPGVGHNVHLEDPDAFVDAVERALA